MMIAALNDSATVYSVLAGAARRRTTRSLGAQLVACVAFAATIVAVSPQWWSLAALLGGGACYAAWGLIVHRLPDPLDRSATFRALLPPALAAAGTALMVGGLFGLAVALFTGTGRSPYTPCGPESTSRYCRAMKAPPPTTRIP